MKKKEFFSPFPKPQPERNMRVREAIRWLVVWSGLTKVTKGITPILIMEDDFERPDQTGLGVAPTGQMWQLTGPGAPTAGISSGDYVVSANTYAYSPISEGIVPLRMDVAFSLNTAGDAVVLHNTADYPNVGLQRMVHWLIQQNSWSLTWWDQPAGFQNKLFAEGTSIAVHSLSLGVSYTASMEIRGREVTLTLPGGGVVKAADDNIVTRSLHGRAAIWQNTGSAFTTKVESVSVWRI